MKYIIVMLTTLFTVCVQAKQIKIAVLDTGFAVSKKHQIKLCKSGHRDFTGEGINDTHEIKHGTNIAGIIDKIATDNYCIMVIKVFATNGESKLAYTVKGVSHAISQNVDIINYSGGGPTHSNIEKQAFINALNHGITVIAAAGNDKTDLDTEKYYPAMYDSRIVVVGNGDKYVRHSTANYGSPVDIWVKGVNIKALGITLTGSSQSTAIVSGHVTNQLNKYRKLANE